MARILMIDDDQTIHDWYAKILRVAGYEVFGETSMEIARMRLQAESFDLEIWDGSIEPFQVDDGAMEAVLRHTGGNRVMIFSGGEEARRLAEKNRVVFLSKREGYRLLGTVRHIFGIRP